jgi:hypothetical protein
MPSEESAGVIRAGEAVLKRLANGWLPSIKLVKVNAKRASNPAHVMALAATALELDARGTASVQHLAQTYAAAKRKVLVDLEQLLGDGVHVSCTDTANYMAHERTTLLADMPWLHVWESLLPGDGQRRLALLCCDGGKGGVSESTVVSMGGSMAAAVCVDRRPKGDAAAAVRLACSVVPQECAATVRNLAARLQPGANSGVTERAAKRVGAAQAAVGTVAAAARAVGTAAPAAAARRAAPSLLKSAANSASRIGSATHVRVPQLLAALTEAVKAEGAHFKDGGGDRGGTPSVIATLASSGSGRCCQRLSEAANVILAPHGLSLSRSQVVTLMPVAGIRALRPVRTKTALRIEAHSCNKRVMWQKVVAGAFSAHSVRICSDAAALKKPGCSQNANGAKVLTADGEGLEYGDHDAGADHQGAVSAFGMLAEAQNCISRGAGSAGREYSRVSEIFPGHSADHTQDRVGHAAYVCHNNFESPETAERNFGDHAHILSALRARHGPSSCACVFLVQDNAHQPKRDSFSLFSIAVLIVLFQIDVLDFVSYSAQQSKYNPAERLHGAARYALARNLELDLPDYDAAPPDVRAEALQGFTRAVARCIQGATYESSEGGCMQAVAAFDVDPALGFEWRPSEMRKFKKLFDAGTHTSFEPAPMENFEGSVKQVLIDAATLVAAHGEDRCFTVNLNSMTFVRNSRHAFFRSERSWPCRTPGPLVHFLAEFDNKMPEPCPAASEDGSPDGSFLSLAETVLANRAAAHDGVDMADRPGVKKHEPAMIFADLDRACDIVHAHASGDKTVAPRLAKLCCTDTITAQHCLELAAYKRAEKTSRAALKSQMQADGRWSRARNVVRAALGLDDGIRVTMPHCLRFIQQVSGNANGRIVKQLKEVHLHLEVLKLAPEEAQVHVLALAEPDLAPALVPAPGGDSVSDGSDAHASSDSDASSCYSSDGDTAIGSKRKRKPPAKAGESRVQPNMRVRQFFAGHGWYNGTVIGMKCGSTLTDDWWTVKYDKDGEEQDYFESAVVAMGAQYQARKAQWHSGTAQL